MLEVRDLRKSFGGFQAVGGVSFIIGWGALMRKAKDFAL